MNIIQKTLASVAFAGFLAAQPIAAQAAPARAEAPTATSEKLGGGIGGLGVIGIFIALLLLAEVTGLIDVFGNDDDLPTSP